jgi:hypothetical protein
MRCTVPQDSTIGTILYYSIYYIYSIVQHSTTKYRITYTIGSAAAIPMSHVRPLRGRRTIQLESGPRSAESGTVKHRFIVQYCTALSTVYINILVQDAQYITWVTGPYHILRGRRGGPAGGRGVVG